MKAGWLSTCWWVHSTALSWGRCLVTAAKTRNAVFELGLGQECDDLHSDQFIWAMNGSPRAPDSEPDEMRTKTY